LTSPTLVGEELLEDCLDGVKAAYLRFGSKGAAVVKVQQALKGLGFAIGTADVLGGFERPGLKVEH
jgi:hypothetical protein